MMRTVISIRQLGAVGLLCLAAFACANDPNEDRIFAGIQKLTTENQLFLDFEGIDTRGAQLSTYIYWQNDPVSNTLKAHVASYRGGKLVHRIVADGENLFDYDLVDHTYSATNYGGYRGRPTSYLSSVPAYLEKLTTGKPSFAARLLRDIDAARVGGQFRTWMPGMLPQQLPDGPDPDPIDPAEFTYKETPTVNFVQYDRSPKQALTYRLEDDPPSSDFKLTALTMTETENIAAKTVTTYWTITISKGIVFDQANFTPYTAAQIKGWRQVVGPDPVKM